MNVPNLGIVSPIMIQSLLKFGRAALIAQQSRRVDGRNRIDSIDRSRHSSNSFLLARHSFNGQA